MIEIGIKAGRDPQALAELIATAVNGQPVADPKVLHAGKLLRDEQERAEAERPSRHDIETVDFARLDAENDWSDV